MPDQFDPAGREDREIHIERILPASHEQVWEAWTNREQLVRWWNVATLSTNLHKFDPRPGGQWTMVSRTKEGKEVVEYLTFDDLLVPERLEFRRLGRPCARYRAVLQVHDHSGTHIDYWMSFRSQDYQATPSVGRVQVEQIIERAERMRIERLAALFLPI